MGVGDWGVCVGGLEARVVVAITNPSGGVNFSTT